MYDDLDDTQKARWGIPLNTKVKLEYLPDNTISKISVYESGGDRFYEVDLNADAMIRGGSLNKVCQYVSLMLDGMRKMLPGTRREMSPNGVTKTKTVVDEPKKSLQYLAERTSMPRATILKRKATNTQLF